MLPLLPSSKHMTTETVRNLGKEEGKDTKINPNAKRPTRSPNPSNAISSNASSLSILLKKSRLGNVGQHGGGQCYQSLNQLMTEVAVLS